MKKLLATLLVSTMALSAIGGLVACGGDDDGKGGNKDPFVGIADWYTEKDEENGIEVGDLKNPNDWVVPEEDSYWLAGTPTAYKDVGTWSSMVAPDGMKFKQYKNNDKLYLLELTLYEGDNFKIRFEGLGWTDEPGKSKLFGPHLLASLKGQGLDYDDTDSDASFVVNQDGKYQLRIDTTPKGDPVVSYARVADAPALNISYNWYIVGDGALNSWTPVEEIEDAAAGTAFEKQPDNSWKLTVVLNDAGTAFKFLNAGQGWNGALNARNCAQLGSGETRGDENFEMLTEGDANGNFSVLTPGTYTFTISADNKSITYTKE